MQDKKEKTFLQEYMSKLTTQILLVHPELERKEVYKLVKEKCKEKFSDKTIELDNEKVSLLTIVNNLRKKEYIISGSGSLFYQHKDKMSVEWFLTDDLGNERKKYKKIKLDNISKKDVDETAMRKFMLGENYQLAFKLLGNSYYGVNAEGNSFFYNPWIAPAITQSGQFVILTAITTFERFAGGNFFFKRIDDITNYINNILKEDYDIRDYFVNEEFFEHDLDKLLFDWLIDKCESNIKKSKKNKNFIKTIISNLSTEEKAKVYFKNNLQNFIRNSSDVKEVMEDLMKDNETFLDTNNPPEECKESLDWLWSIFNVCVAYYYTDFFQKYNATYKGRRAVLTVSQLTYQPSLNLFNCWKVLYN